MTFLRVSGCLDNIMIFLRVSRGGSPGIAHPVKLYDRSVVDVRLAIFVYLVKVELIF